MHDREYCVCLSPLNFTFGARAFITRAREQALACPNFFSPYNSDFEGW